jgi:biotin transport system substrate-specific component
MTSFAYAEIFRPLANRRAMVYDIGVSLLGSVVIALCAQLSFYLPASPVPVTAQSFAVLLTGAILGRRRAVMAVIAYLAWGSLGMPVFAAGKAGFGVFFGITGGYLIGFVAAGFITGFLAEAGWDRRFWMTALAMTLGDLAIYVIGVPWLAAFVGWDKAILTGFLVFLPGDLLKILVASLILPSGWKLLNRKRKNLQGY